MTSPPAFEAPVTEPKAYVGCCHCQATKFTISVPSFDSVEYCNCSFCTPRGLIFPHPRPAADDIKFERKGPTTKYEFGNKTVTFEFCTTCGNLICAIDKATQGIQNINVRLLENVDFGKLKHILQHDYSSNPSPAGPFPGPPFAPHESASNKNIYSGSCHCGAVSVSTRIAPFGTTKTLACNCSWCSRWSALHCYPKPTTAIRVSGFEALSAYRGEKPPMRGKLAMRFCGTCGQQMVVTSDAPAVDEDGAEVENAVEKLGYEGTVLCVNVRPLWLEEEERAKTQDEAVQWDGRKGLPLYTVD